MFKKDNGKHYNEELFQQEDFDDIQDRLQVEKLARQQALNNKPDSNSPFPNADENKITADFQERLSFVKQEMHKKLAIYNHLTNKLHEISSALTESKYASQNFEQGAVTLSENYRHKLDNLREDINLLQKDLLNFKIENDLTREALYPNSKILHIGFILVIVLVETLLNSFFFAKGNELGLLGGASQSLIISFINMMLAFFFGNYFCRNLYLNKQKAKKIFSIIGMLTIVCIVIIFNLLVGHLRVQLGVDYENAYTASIDSFLSNPLYLQDFDSVILVGIGILMFILGAIDFFKMDDSYPSYGKLTRKLYESQDYFTEVKELFFDELNDLQQQKVDEIDKKQTASRMILNEVQEIPSYRQRLDSSYKEFYTQLNKTYKSIVALYRNTNKEARKDEPPKYFYNFDELDEKHLIDCTDSSLQKNLNKAKKEVEEFPHVIGEQKRAINEYVQLMINRINNISNVLDQHETPQ